ncbi:MAG: GntR family transcriptional regulator [Actinomycetia bacterium]|nr:GntR family transcriptional regulator [Actinomycetes bacterium]MCP4085171.1 GntR family transcriptional regulator [Actinomycetes bacterium]
MIAPLDRSSPLPLWAQLEADLRQRLGDGEFDDRFPTDAELTSQYDVSRHTVREAVRHLNQNGLLRRERGRGTVVNKSEFEQRLGALYSLFDSVESQGVEQRSEILAVGETTEPVAAANLGLELDERIWHLERLRFAGEEPLAVDRVWLPLDVGSQIAEQDFTHTALYVELEGVGGGRPDRGWERITPVVPTAIERRQLGLAKGDAAFSLERLGSLGDQPLEWRVTVIRGDRFRFVVDWGGDNDGEVRFTPAD